MSKNTQKTVHHTNLELVRALSVQFIPQPFSTINQHMNVLVAESQAALPPGEYPTVQYLAIGRGGHTVMTDAGTNATLVDILRHGPTDARLFEHIPFIIRETASPLTATEREDYRMRTVETIGGTEYEIYWMKKIQVASTQPEMTVFTIEDGEVIQSDPYVPSNNSQNPQPIVVDNNDLNLADGRYISVKSAVNLSFDTNDIEEIITACEVYYGTQISPGTNASSFATISEIAVCSGVDLIVTPASGGEPAIKEVTHAQVANFIGTELPLQAHPKSLALDYGLATTQPYPTV